MSYSVGQILFVVMNKKNQVYPMQVVEEITKKTLKGEITSYVLQGGSSTQSTIMLDQVDGEVFDSADEVRRVLQSRATTQINKLVAAAVEKSKEWYSLEIVPSEKLESISNDPSQISEEDTTVTLPDGTKARLKSN
jgi:hypothetical protein